MVLATKLERTLLYTILPAVNIHGSEPWFKKEVGKWLDFLPDSIRKHQRGIEPPITQGMTASTTKETKTLGSKKQSNPGTQGVDTTILGRDFLG